MRFEVVEVKKLGRDVFFSLSVRLEKKKDDGCGECGGEPKPSPYTIHAVLPYIPEFGNLQIGQTFEFKQSF